LLVGSRPDSSVSKSPVHASSPVQASAFLHCQQSLVLTFSRSPFAIAPSASAPSLEAVSVPFGCFSRAGQNVDVAVKVDSDTKEYSSTLNFSEVGLDIFAASSLGCGCVG